jgi:CheY-like chemotaxis protein
MNRQFSFADKPMVSPVKSMSLLVVEDNRDAADSLAMVLTNCGYHVSIAYDGDQAIRMVDAADFHVVICDIGLPGRSGYEVAAHIRRRRGPAPLIVAVSAYASDTVRDSAHAAGFDSYFSKPVDPTDLEQMLVQVANADATK